MKFKILYPVVISFLLYVNISESVVFNANRYLIVSLFLSSMLSPASGTNIKQLEEKIRDVIARVRAEGRSLENNPSRILNPDKKEEVINPRLQRGVSDCENEQSFKTIDRQKKELSKLQQANALLLAELNVAYGKGYDVVKKEQEQLKKEKEQLKEENKQLRRKKEAMNSRLTKCRNKADKWKGRAKSYKKKGKN